VPADLAKQLLPALKRKRGVTVHAPELSTSKAFSCYVIFYSNTAMYSVKATLCC
jgi:uncharacterized protein GlcG (DUF336 family)